MNNIFAKRRKSWHAQNIKYLRYVFNDHFVLFLMILLGALVVQYVNFLQFHQLGFGGKLVLVLFVSVLSQIFGRLATFIEPADKVFLLVKELEVRKYLLTCLLRSLIIPILISGILIAISAPLLKFNLLILMIWFLLLLGLKTAWLFFYLYQIQKNDTLNWSKLLADEGNRKTALLRFFALFTNVKGLKSGSHRRKYLDFLLPKTKRTYEYLFMRGFLRSGDYLGLSLRLMVLSVLSMIFVSNGIVATILVSVFNYLLVFQMMSLHSFFDYQLLTRIYPLKKSAKNGGLRLVLFRLMLFVTFFEFVFALIFIRPIWLVLVILLVNFVLTKFYVRIRLKNKR